MKKSKKLLRILSATAIAAVMATSMVSTAAFAAPVDLPTQNVTMPTKISTLKFDIYQVASAAYDDTNGTGYYTYEIKNRFDLGTNLAVDANGRLTYRNKAGVTKVLDASNNDPDAKATDAKELAGMLKKRIAAGTGMGMGIAPTMSDLSAGDTAHLAPGYYLILTKGELIGSPILVSVTDSPITLENPKTSTITFDKSITGITNGSLDDQGVATGRANTAEGAVGSKVTYQIKTNFPAYSPDLANEEGKLDKADTLTNFKITDVPSRGLQMPAKSAIAVKVDGQPAPADKYTITMDTTDNAKGGRGFVVEFTDDQFVYDNGEKEVTVDFTATVTKDSVVQGAIENDADLIYDNNYDTGGSSATKHDDTDVYRAEIDIYKIYKDLANNNVETPLAGAGFTIYKRTIMYPPFYSKDDVIMAEKFTDADGKISNINNLPAGTYFIEETTVPAGFKKADIKQITITANKTDGEFNGTYTFEGLSADGEAKIENIQGQTLPGTGGIGTTIFTVGGITLILAAGVMYTVYAKKRKSE